MTNEQEEVVEITEENKSRKILKNYIENDDFYNLYKKQNKQEEVGGIHIDFCKAIETVLNMLKEKDKMIDLLIDKLNQNYSNVFKHNEVKEIIEIYEKIKNISNLSGIELRKECIKQYFEQKATNNG